VKRYEGGAPGRRTAGEIDPALELLSRWLDTLFRVPGTEWRVGLDALVGLIPGIGDTVTAALSFYILSTGVRYGVPRVTMLRMALNVAIDYVIGAIPFAGDVFDVAWRANVRNVELLRRHAVGPGVTKSRGQLGDWLFVAAIMIGLVALLVGVVTIVWYGVSHLFPRSAPS
jgi:hypothetical protein